jgi:hypothetical protein
MALIASLSTAAGFQATIFDALRSEISCAVIAIFKVKHAFSAMKERISGRSYNRAPT